MEMHNLKAKLPRHSIWEAWRWKRDVGQAQSLEEPHKSNWPEDSSEWYLLQQSTSSAGIQNPTMVSVFISDHTINVMSPSIYSNITCDLCNWDSLQLIYCNIIIFPLVLLGC